MIMIGSHTVFEIRYDILVNGITEMSDAIFTCSENDGCCVIWDFSSWTCVPVYQLLFKIRPI
jgi:hypothetical protein